MTGSKIGAGCPQNAEREPLRDGNLFSTFRAGDHHAGVADAVEDFGPDGFCPGNVLILLLAPRQSCNTAKSAVHVRSHIGHIIDSLTTQR